MLIKSIDGRGTTPLHLMGVVSVLSTLRGSFVPKTLVVYGKINWYIMVSPLLKVLRVSVIH